MHDRILLVEDDSAIARAVTLNLGLEGYEVRVAGDVARGFAEAQAWKPDLVILDRMLPGGDGLDVCRRLRGRGVPTPILILSAKGTESDKVEGLDAGADDYLAKPFGLQELLARVKALLRRARVDTRPVAVRFGDVEADFAAGIVTRAGAPVDLTSRELQLLAFLIEREGRVLTRQAILDAVWGDGYFGTERTVDNFITRLRQKLDRPGWAGRVHGPSFSRALRNCWVPVYLRQQPVLNESTTVLGPFWMVLGKHDIIAKHQHQFAIVRGNDALFDYTRRKIVEMVATNHHWIADAVKEGEREKGTGYVESDKLVSMDASLYDGSTALCQDAFH